VVYKLLIVLVGILLGSHMLAVAQTPAPHIVFTRERVAPTAVVVRTVSTPLVLISFVLPQIRGKTPTRFKLPFGRAYERDESLESLSQMREFKTLFLTQSSLPLTQLWGGHLRLDGFTSTLQMQNVQLGPSAAGGLHDFRPARQSLPGGPRSFDFYGVSMSFYFGRDSRTRRPTQVWGRMTRIVGTVLN